MRLLQRLFGRTRLMPASSLTYRARDGVYVLRGTGVLCRATVDRIQTVAACDGARRARDIRVLIVLTDFLGWKQGGDGNDTNSLWKRELARVRIAVVGDACWEAATLAELADGPRRGEVRYFTREREGEARAWLADSGSPAWYGGFRRGVGRPEAAPAG